MKQGAASANQLRFLEQYYSQEQIADVLGISPRYQRLIKEGKRSGAKYADAIRSLYDLLRKSPKPPKKRKRPPRKKSIISYAYVPDVMNILFRIFEPRTWKTPRRNYQHKQSRYFVSSPEWPTGKVFDTWDSFFIVLGVIPLDDPKFKRYQRVMVEEEIEEDEDEEMEEKDADSIDMFLEMLDGLSEREQQIISHIPLEKWLQDAIGAGLPNQDSMFVNFWISRVSTSPMTPEQVKGLMVEIARDSIDISNNESDDVQYHLLGVYGFSGWNSQEGGD